MLRIKDLNKKFGSYQVLSDINLEVSEGSITGLVGPNGAGKTTLLQAIMGITKPDEGSITFMGQDIQSAWEVKNRIGYVPDQSVFYPGFTVADMVRFYGYAYATWDEERYAELSKVLVLPLNQKIKSLSKGMKAQLAILLALSFRPKMLILDEPTAGLDPINRRLLYSLMLDEVAENGTNVLISSHGLAELERICDHIVFIDKGRILLDSDLDSLKQQIRKVQVVFQGEFPSELKGHPDLIGLEQFGRVYRLIFQSDDILRVIQQYQPVLLEDIDISLEEIFIYNVRGVADDVKFLSRK